MYSRAVRIMCMLSLCAAVMWLTGCACCPKKACAEPVKCVRGPCPTVAGDLGSALPPNAKCGECYAKVYIPPKYDTVCEKVLVREAYEQMEVVPAQYEWVEEQVCVKEASKQLEIAPPQFATRDQKYVAEPYRCEWEVNKNPRCVAFPGQPARDVFCLVAHPCVEKTFTKQCVEKPACVREVTIPAEFQTVRRQKLVCPATTRKITIPAEYAEIQKTVKVCDAKVVWQRVECDGSPGVVQVPPAPGAEAATPPLPRTAANVRAPRR